MISETMPLNEWPLPYLKNLLLDLDAADFNWGYQSPTTKKFISVVQAAIKDVEFEQERRAEHVMDKRYEGDGNFADNH